jgi:hypothetical protein
MKISNLVFIGIKGSVVALNRATGEQVWATPFGGSGFVNVVVEDEKVFATCSGQAFTLDAFTGEVLWKNGLKGFGFGLATIATPGQVGSGQMPLMAEKRRRDQQAASAAAASA